MEPQIKYIAFFDEMELVIKKRGHFPSFKNPFIDLKVNELPTTKNIAVLVAIENINASSASGVKIVLTDPLNEEILKIEKPITDKDADKLMIGFEREVKLKVEGTHTLEVFLDHKFVGNTSFVVEKVNKNE